jgi:type IV pilus assembly protein PilA
LLLGALAAIALPSFLQQIGKAKDTEIKNAVGTVNRTQKSYHFEKQTFAPALSFLGISIPTAYVSNATGLGIVADATSASVQPENTNAVNDGTRAYSGRLDYIAGVYLQILCQSDAVATVAAAPDSATACATGTTEVR